MLTINTINLSFLLSDVANHLKKYPQKVEEGDGYDYSIPLNEWNGDMFAAFVCDCILTIGTKTNQDFNKLVGLDFANGTDIFKYSVEIGLPHGKNYDEFGTVRGFLYDVWEQYKKLL